MWPIFSLVVVFFPLSFKKIAKYCQMMPGAHETLMLNWPLLNTPTKGCQFIIEWFILEGNWSNLLIRITVQSLFLTLCKLHDYLIKCWLGCYIFLFRQQASTQGFIADKSQTNNSTFWECKSSKSTKLRKFPCCLEYGGQWVQNTTRWMLIIVFPEMFSFFVVVFCEMLSFLHRHCV